MAHDRANSRYQTDALRQGSQEIDVQNQLAVWHRERAMLAFLAMLG
jgi:hypothetical protein